jgi:shikimate dehydrogenase
MVEPSIFAIYGNPVAHSKSPQMHNYVFSHLDYPAIYTRVHLLDGSQLKKDFFERKLSGANVTVPHKEAAFEACDEVRGFAQAVGVVNTLVNEDGKLIGYNTDADGFLYALENFGTIKSILVLGAGGTAKALVQKFIDEGFNVTVVNRSQKRLNDFQDLQCQTFTWKNFQAAAYDLIVNTTSAGLEDDNYPINQMILEELFENSKYAADVIYGKKTPFLKLAATKNLPHIDGQAMLIGQGVLANELFSKGALSKDAILSAMTKSFELS